MKHYLIRLCCRLSYHEWEVGLQHFGQASWLGFVCKHCGAYGPHQSLTGSR